MKKIKFSHRYLKFGEQIGNRSQVILVKVERVFLQNLSKEFLEKDTAYISKEQNIEHYELPKRGEYLLLTFRQRAWEFSTLRRSTPEKDKYYFDSLGELFEVVIEE